MWFKCLRVTLTVLFLVGLIVSKSFADDTEEELKALKAQVQELMKRIEKLETEQAKAKEDAAKAKDEVAKIKETTTAAQAGRVDLANALSKLKLKGRWAAGFFDSGKAGSYPGGSWEAPEAKIQFSFLPDDINTVVMRFNLNNATFNNLDYFYLQSKNFLKFLKDTPFTLDARLGRFKLGFGEETWSDNPVESVLPSNSAAKASFNDEGLELAGKIKLDKIKMGSYTLKPLGWVLSVSDGNSGTGSDTSTSKAFMGKLYYTPLDPLYLSATFYNSGDLKNSNSEFSIAGLATPPTGATTWRRTVWELDARYDFGKGKKPLDPPAFSDSKAIVRLSYGAFYDSGGVDRDGNFGFAEGTYNLNKKFYLAGRYSFVDMSGDVTATLNSIANANKYTRYSLGIGYRWSENTILKLSFDLNKESGPNIDDADNNLVSAIVATQF